MAKHRRITFAKGTVGRFAKKHGITMTYTQVPAIMICRKDDHPGQKHFILTFKAPGGKFLKLPYSQGALVEGYPELPGVLEGLGSDMTAYESNPTAEEFCSAFGIDPEDCEEEFEVMEGLIDGLRKFFTPAAYAELLDMACQGDAFEMEGGREWRRSLTCEL